MEENKMGVMPVNKLLISMALPMMIDVYKRQLFARRPPLALPDRAPSDIPDAQWFPPRRTTAATRGTPPMFCRASTISSAPQSLLHGCSAVPPVR